VARHEKKLAAELKATQDQLSAQNKKLRQQQQEKHNLVLEISKQLADLTKIRNEKRSLVRRLRNNKTARLLAIKKLESSKESLLEAIRRSELARKAGKKTGTAEKRWIPLKGNFSKNKGRMNWPVSGKIITKFGKYTDPILKTTLKNTGIDIKADFGKPIRAVYSGRVSLITFMAGYGNTVILEHGGGYYTVYSHLNEIYVAQGETVEAGKTIATVGESGSLTGPKLHFELYAKQKPVNPLTWLRKN
jgi:septal ring factor EnvC (AmiA/AmiB activator)